MGVEKNLASSETSFLEIQQNANKELFDTIRAGLGNLDIAVKRGYYERQTATVPQAQPAAATTEEKKDTQLSTEKAKNDVKEQPNMLSSHTENLEAGVKLEEQLQKELVGENKSFKSAYESLLKEKSTGNTTLDTYRSHITQAKLYGHEVGYIFIAMSRLKKQMGDEQFKKHMEGAKDWNIKDAFVTSLVPKEWKEDRLRGSGEILGVNNKETDIAAMEELLRHDTSKVLRELNHDISLMKDELAGAKQAVLTEEGHLREDFKKEMQSLLSKKSAEAQEKNTQLERVVDTKIAMDVSYNGGKGLRITLPLQKSINITDKKKIWADALSIIEKESGTTEDADTKDLLTKLKSASSDAFVLTMNTETNELQVAFETFTKEEKDKEKKSEAAKPEYIAEEVYPTKSIEVRATLTPERLPKGLPTPLSYDIPGRTYQGNTPAEVEADPSLLNGYTFKNRDIGPVDLKDKNKGWVLADGKIIGVYIDTDHKEVAWINTPPNSQKFLIDFPYTTQTEYEAKPKEFTQPELAKLVFGDEKETEKYTFYMAYKVLPDSTGARKAFRLEVKAYAKQVVKKPEVKEEKKVEGKKDAETKTATPVVSKEAVAGKKEKVTNNIANTPAEKKNAESFVGLDKLGTEIAKNLGRIFELKVDITRTKETGYKDGILRFPLDATDTTQDGPLKISDKRQLPELIKIIQTNPSKVFAYTKGESLRLEVKDHVLQIGTQKQFEKIEALKVDELYSALLDTKIHIISTNEKPTNPGIRDVQFGKNEIYVRLNKVNVPAQTVFMKDLEVRKGALFELLPAIYKKQLGLKSGADIDVSFRKNKLVLSKKSDKIERTKEERLLDAKTKVQGMLDGMQKIYGTGEGDRIHKANILYPKLLKTKEYIEGIKALDPTFDIKNYQEKFLKISSPMERDIQQMYKIAKQDENNEKVEEYQKSYRLIYDKDIASAIDKRESEELPKTLR